MLSVLGMTLFVLAIAATALALNKIIWYVGELFSFWDEKPRQDHWYNPIVDFFGVQMLMQQAMIHEALDR